MKKYVFLFITTFILTGSLYAQFVDNISNDVINGPVKKTTTIIRQNSDPSDVEKTIIWYDSIGRIVKTEEYGEEGPGMSYVYQYTDSNICWRFTYERKRLVKGAYCKIYLNSSGQKIASHEFYNNHLTRVDSIAYDAQGRVVETYASEYIEREPSLTSLYTYDSTGRLTEERNIKTGKRYTITYLPNGDYTKQFFDKNGKTYSQTCIVDKKGQLNRIESDEEKVKYARYDRFGNWLKREASVNTHSFIGWIGSTTERTIEYYK